MAVAHSQLPRHVAVIMDGNGRWAEQRGLPRLAGHREGAESVRAVVRRSRQVGIKALTLYAFSAQNWARPGDEIKGLMELLSDYLVGERDELTENQIRLQAIGETNRLPPDVRERLQETESLTAGFAEMTLTLALSYDGRADIARAARLLAESVAKGEIAPTHVNQTALEARLSTASLPECDLLIRTSGECRLSNFLLWELAYAELYFTSCMWPEFREAQFDEALEIYTTRQRRFGKTSAQVLAEENI